MPRQYDSFMQQVFKDNPDLFGTDQNGPVFEWIYEGWRLFGTATTPTPEQIAAALLMEANTQDECVKAGDSDPSFPKRLRELAYGILDHYHKPQHSYKIIYVDEEKQERLVERFTATRERAVLKTVEMARRHASRLPNDPKVDQSGPEEVSIYIAQYRVATYRLERE